MLDTEIPLRTFLRFGVQRKKELLRDSRNAYDGLVLPANILLYQYRSTPLVVFMTQRPFFVDPMSYLFGQPYDHFKRRAGEGTDFKPSFRKLMVGHGLDPKKFLRHNHTRLLHIVANSDKNVQAFTDNAVALQWENVWDGVRQAKDFMSEAQQNSLDEGGYRPAFVIPPYFLYEPDSLTTELNAALLNCCWAQHHKTKDLFPMVFLLRRHLGTAFMRTVVQAVRRKPFPGYCVWIEGFDERIATAGEITALIGLTSSLSEGDRQVVMLYGGFFSLLLHHFGITAVCHGLGYGEARAVDAAARQTSGPPPIRYYVRELHSFLTLDNALKVLRARPDLLCECPVCRRLVRGNPENVTNYGHEEALAEMHFLYNRYQERKEIAQGTVQDAIQRLEWADTLCSDLEEITKPYRVGFTYKERPIVDPGYIANWLESLRKATQAT